MVAGFLSQAMSQGQLPLATKTCDTKTPDFQGTADLRRSNDLPKKLREMVGTKTSAPLVHIYNLGNNQIVDGHHC